MKKRGLGKGLDAIFAENTDETTEGAVSVKISEIEPNRDQPRKEFDSEALSELADSISQHGVLQPLLLRPLLTGGYRIVAGERRWRAARMAGLTEVPAIEAQDFTQEEVSKAVGKSRPAITNALRLLNLPEDIQGMLERGEITAGHARTLLSFKSQEDMRLGAQKAKDGASVRELEALAKRLNEKKESLPKTPRKNQYFEEAQLAVGEYLNRRVKVAGSKKKGTLQIEFYGEEDLQNLLHDLHLR